MLYFCPQPPPIVQQFCNVIDCKPGWKKGSWSKVNKMIFIFIPTKQSRQFKKCEENIQLLI